MIELRDHDQNARARGGVVDCPLHTEARGGNIEFLTHFVHGGRLARMSAEQGAREETAGHFVVELRELHDVAAARVQKAGNGRHLPGCIDARDGKDAMMLPVGSAVIARPSSRSSARADRGITAELGRAYTISRRAAMACGYS